jgi:predicted alpha/beta-fold hydrolase
MRTTLPAEPDFPPFRPRFPWLGRDLQTLRNFFTGSWPPVAGIETERLVFEMPDGTGDSLTGALSRPGTTNPAAGRALVVLVHGLAGCEESAYILESARCFLNIGHPVLRLNLRGSAATQPNCREHYHAGRDEDLVAVLDQLGERSELQAGLVLIGFSLGGNMVLKFLASQGRDYPLCCAISVSAPIDLAAAAERFLQPRNQFYHAWILHHMKQEAIVAKGLGPRGVRTIRTARTIYEFDDRVVAPRNGFQGAQDYYRRCSAAQFLGDIRVPTLLISALDDPWIPARDYLNIDWTANPYLVPLLPQSGGHVGFHDARGTWHNRVSALFIEKLGGRFCTKTRNTRRDAWDGVIPTQDMARYEPC